MKKHVVILLFMIAAISIGSAAYAQYDSNDQGKIGIRFSFFSPSDSNLNDIKSVWMGPVFDYNLTFDKFERPRTMVSLGWFGEEKNPTRAKMLPLTYTYTKRYGTNPDSTWYVSGNAGLYFTSFRTWAGFNEINESGMNYGLGVSVGKEFGSIWFTELGYNYVSKLDVKGVGIGFSGLMISAGTRMAY